MQQDIYYRINLIFQYIKRTYNYKLVKLLKRWTNFTTRFGFFHCSIQFSSTMSQRGLISKKHFKTFKITDTFIGKNNLRTQLNNLERKILSHHNDKNIFDKFIHLITKLKVNKIFNKIIHSLYKKMLSLSNINTLTVEKKVWDFHVDGTGIPQGFCVDVIHVDSTRIFRLFTWIFG